MDKDKLIQPLVGALACGENLEDTQLLASFDAYRIFGHATPLAGEVDWRAIRSHSLEALEKSKDLRLLAHLAAAALRTEGLKSYADLLEVASAWLTSYWAEVYPLIDDDAILRRNALNGLADGMAVLDALRRTPLISNRQLGALSFRQIEIAAGRMAPADEEPPGPNEDQIRAIFTATAQEELIALRNDVSRASDASKAISDTMSEQGGGSEATPDFAPLLGILTKMRLAVQAHILEADPSQAGEGGAAGGAGGASIPGSIGTRQDAIRMLDAVAAFFRANEPSSPVPLLVDRAKRLVALDFLAVLAELTPDAVPEAKRAGGIRDE